eukprot:1726364-Rhodomonas_salina.1
MPQVKKGSRENIGLAREPSKQWTANNTPKRFVDQISVHFDDVQRTWRHLQKKIPLDLVMNRDQFYILCDKRLRIGLADKVRGRSLGSKQSMLVLTVCTCWGQDIEDLIGCLDKDGNVRRTPDSFCCPADHLEIDSRIIVLLELVDSRIIVLLEQLIPVSLFFSNNSSRIRVLVTGCCVFSGDCALRGLL